MPSPYLSTSPSGRRTDRRRKVHKAAAKFVHGLARTKSIAEERELDGQIPSAMEILAIHDACFAGCISRPHSLNPCSELRASTARVADFGSGSVRHLRTDKTDVRKLPSHPRVKRIVQEQVCQKRAHDAALRCTSARALRALRRGLHRSFQPSLDVEQEPGFLGVLSQGLHQEGMIDVVKQRPDVEFKHPVVIPASTPGDQGYDVADFPGLYP